MSQQKGTLRWFARAKLYFVRAYVHVCACVFGENGFSKAVMFILCFSSINIFPSLSEALLFGGLFCSHLGSMSRFFSW